MRKGLTDYFIWFCDWCDSTHLVPNVLQGEYRQYCPACGRQSAGMHHEPEFTAVFPV